MRELNLRLSCHGQRLSIGRWQFGVPGQGGRILRGKGRILAWGQVFQKKHTRVTAVTERVSTMGETAFVNMVRKASKNSLLRAGRHEVAVERGSRS